MTDEMADKQGVYTLSRVKGITARGLLGPRKVMLPDAVPPCEQGVLSPNSFGCVVGAHEAPNRNDRYIAEFLNDNEYRILAYIDRYGRVFSTDEPVFAPPAREPDLMIAKFEEQENPKVQVGCVQVRDDGGLMRQVSQYRLDGSKYALFDSWYDFGPYAQNLSYDTALARCYLAFVHRPKLRGTAMPSRGLDSLHRRLQEEKPLAALGSIVNDVRAAQADPVMRPPALACCFARWLEEAGLNGVRAAAGGIAEVASLLGVGSEAAAHEPLRLVRTARYANTYYLGVEDEENAPSQKTVWALESVLNRFLLIEESFGPQAAVATDADCGKRDVYLIETIAQQVFSEDGAIEPSGEEPVREWDLRIAIGKAMEMLRLPYRFSADYRCDERAGVVAFNLVAPDAGLMPRKRWDDLRAQWTAASSAEREAQVLRYAEHLGVALAAAAFKGSLNVQHVVVTAWPFSEDASEGIGEAGKKDAGEAGKKDASGSEFPDNQEPLYQVTFTRDAFCRDGGGWHAASADPAPFFNACGATYGANASAVAPFAAVDQLPSNAPRKDLPEVGTAQLEPYVQDALGARTMYDMRISYDADLRRVGEQIAEEVVRSGSATEAIRAVRSTQDATDNPLVYEACTRLMAQLAEGSVDSGDQNVLVARFMGDDVYAVALNRARALVQKDPAKAVEVLSNAIAEAEAGNRYADNSETVHRAFDSYVARVVYNRMLAAAGAAGTDSNLRRKLDTPILSDVGKRVELVPATLAFCYLEAARMLEESFSHGEDALRYGLRCVEMAPTFSVAYRQTARAYMLMGDMESAANILERCLHIALAPDEIAVAYYQLAYVKWKAGFSRAGVACYLKSITTSPVYAAQSTIELQELLREPDVSLIAHDKIDSVLAEEGIPIAPQPHLLDQVDVAMIAATNANLFTVARSLLALRLRYRPDDALVNVLKSLETE